MSVMDNKNDRSLIERQVTTFERCTTCRWDWMQTTMTIIARGHTQSVERITHRQRPTSLCERSPHPSSHGELNAASLKYHIITDRHFAPSIRPIYPNRWSLCVFVESHATGSRTSMEATTFIRSMSTLYAANYLFVRHLFEWCSGCLMNRISFHWSRSWINIFFLIFKHARETWKWYNLL